jgi:hypothetical protein
MRPRQPTQETPGHSPDRHLAVRPTDALLNDVVQRSSSQMLHEHPERGFIVDHQ